MPDWTAIGNLDSPWEAIVDQRGLVTPWPEGWSLDWWVGADDRWHLPTREVAVRQRLLDDTPVVETAMRVPSGDVIERVYCVRHGDDELVVVEIENASPLPVALALSIRPVNPNGAAPIKHIDVVDGTTVTVDGHIAVLLPKSPSRAAGSTLEAGDVESIVLGGDAGEAFIPVRCRKGGASAAFIWPLPHRQTLRVGLPLVPVKHSRRRRQHTSSPTALPTAQQVANGWQLHGERGMRLVLPDARLQSAIEANRRFLLVLHNGPVDRRRFSSTDTMAMASALDHYGCSDVARRTMRSYPERDPSAVLQRALGELEAGDRRALGGLFSALDAATPTWTWPDGHDRRTAADFLMFVRNLLVRDVDGGLALCTLVPDTWLGQSLEVHDAPTDVGRISYALRWHGDRPAVLWELDPHDGVGDVTITVPGLDPTWSTTEHRGDALLAPVLPPGTPVTLRR